MLDEIKIRDEGSGYKSNKKNVNNNLYIYSYLDFYIICSILQSSVCPKSPVHFYMVNILWKLDKTFWTYIITRNTP